MSAKAAVATAPRALACDPLSVDDILQGLYRPEPARPARSGVVTRDRLPSREETLAADHLGDGEPTAEKKPRPTHYKVVCISLYNEDIARLDDLVKQLKRRGHTKANKSQVIRAALEQIDLDKVPRSH